MAPRTPRLQHHTVKPTPPANEDECRQCGDEEGVEECFMEGGSVLWITPFFEGGAGGEHRLLGRKERKGVSLALADEKAGSLPLLFL